MKIYTKRGDEGQTGLFGDVRVSKDHLRIRAYGTLDELNAAIGMVLAPIPGQSGMGQPLESALFRIQGEIFQLGSELATPRGKVLSMELLDEEKVKQLEAEIDLFEKDLSPLKSFILPGGTVPSAQLHFARTVSRRAEREVVILHRGEPLRSVVLQYLNRLSDYLFVCARYANHQQGVPDREWVSPKIKS